MGFYDKYDPIRDYVEGEPRTLRMAMRMDVYLLRGRTAAVKDCSSNFKPVVIYHIMRL